MKKQDDGSFKNVFFQTKGGKLLKKLVENGMELNKNEYYIDYAYSLVPKVISRDKYNRATKYKPPKQSEANEEYKYLYERIVQEKPDIIVPTGNIGCKALIGKSAISNLRGVPEKVTVTARYGMRQEDYEIEYETVLNKLDEANNEFSDFINAYSPNEIKDRKSLSEEEDTHVNRISSLEEQLREIENSTGTQSHDVWVLPMYSMEYMLVNPSIQNLIEADFVTLQKFVEQGDKAFEASPVDYEFVDDIKRVREIFNKELPKAPIVAWDLETNTLHPEMRGAKPLVVSLSWEEGQGVTIPLEHKDFDWLPGHIAEIYNLIEDFIGDKNIIKVGANIQYDMRFLNLTKGFTKFKNHRDTKTMYYMLVNQDVSGSLQLSDLSYELTDMGGYDRPLEDFKKQYIKDYKEKEKERIDNLKAEHKQKVKEEKAQAKKDGVKYTPKKVKFPKVEPPKNEVDGSDFNYEWIPLRDMLHPYASGDTDACLRIHNKLDAVGQKSGNEGIRKLYTGHYTNLKPALAKMESNGVMMDTEYNDVLQKAYAEEQERLVQEMRKLSEVKQLEAQHRELYEKGLEEWAKPKKDRDENVAKLRDKYKEKLEFNPNSSDDKQRVLYKIMGIELPYNKEYVTDSVMEDDIPEEEIDWFHYKTNKDALNYISDNFEHASALADLLLEHSLVKTRNQGFTYKLRNMIDEYGLIHGNFNSEGTETSRLSSSSPNLQQLPKSTGDVTRFDYKYPIKRMFSSRFKNGVVLQADYSSLESRIMALAANDEEMLEAFLNNADIHKETASLVFNIPIDEVTSDQRSSSKAVTFGLAYGEHPFSFAPKHDMTVEEAEKLFDDYFRTKPRIKQLIDDCQEFAKQNGYIETLQGFRRNLRDVYSQDKQKRNEALRQATNTRIQGTGAFLTNESVIHIQNFIEKNNFKSKLIMTVHDSIVMDCPPEEVHTMAYVMKHIMENLPIDWLFVEHKGETIRYPIKADVEIGMNYNDAVDYNKEDMDTFKEIKNYCKYYLDLENIENYKDSKIITEDKFEYLTEAIQNRKGVYQNAG